MTMSKDALKVQDIEDARWVLDVARRGVGRALEDQWGLCVFWQQGSKTRGIAKAIGSPDAFDVFCGSAKLAQALNLEQARRLIVEHHISVAGHAMETAA